MSQPSSAQFAKAIAAFDAYHQKDPNTEIENGQTFPSELLYVQRITDRLGDFAPDASESLWLAARCQHIGRWEIPRTDFPMDRKGYLRWRQEEKFHHSRIAEKILTECGYASHVIDEVQSLLLKKELRTNPSTQLLEDVVCLVFIEYYLEDFAAKHDDEKVVSILRKTLAKMSDRGIEGAKGLSISPKIAGLLAQAQVVSKSPSQ